LPVPGSYRLMGVLNVTPDSFSDGGLFVDQDSAIAHGRRLVGDGADLVDVGGESTRPGAEAVSAEVEIARTAGVVAGLAADGVKVSIDTSKADVAEAALEAGAAMVNDVTAFEGDERMAAVCADAGCEVVLMHMQGTPRTMQENPTYDDVVVDIRDYLARRADVAVAAGVDPARISVDPGIGFGKTVEHNLEILRRLDEFAVLGFPVLIGTSRKSFIGKITGRDVNDRLGATIATNVLALAGGASIFRVHDVAEHAQALKVAQAILTA